MYRKWIVVAAFMIGFALSSTCQAQCVDGQCRLPRVTQRIEQITSRPLVKRAVQPVQVVRERFVARRPLFQRGIVRNFIGRVLR
jgi:hypothetical protein